jgi:hypothetical protein
MPMISRSDPGGLQSRQVWCCTLPAKHRVWSLVLTAPLQVAGESIPILDRTPISCASDRPSPEQLRHRSTHRLHVLTIPSLPPSNLERSKTTDNSLARISISEISRPSEESSSLVRATTESRMCCGASSFRRAHAAFCSSTRFAERRASFSNDRNLACSFSICSASFEPSFASTSAAVDAS